MIDVLKALLLGAIEGITEWLPISSTGHLIIAERFISLGLRPEFIEVFDVVVQLGAIFAVILLFWNKLWPFTTREDTTSGVYRLVGKVGFKKTSAKLWLKVIIGCLPAAVIGVLLDDWLNEKFYNEYVVSATLIIYGILFIVVEAINKKRQPSLTTLRAVNWKTALLIGCFQVLSLIPGTSRSGATILGAMILGTSRTVAAEYSFYMSVPIMFGASFLKLIKFGIHFEAIEIVVLAAGMVMAFIVSLLAIKFLMGFIRKNSFAAFGYYRIILGIILLLCFRFI